MQPGLAQPLDERASRSVADRAVGEQQRALRGAEADGVLEVLHADRDPGQRTDVLARRHPRVDRGGLGQRRLAVEGDERVRPVVDLLDPVEGARR